MIFDFFAFISSFIINVISNSGYLGITVLMALESACIPIPSEIIMPFAGFLVWEMRFDLWAVVLWGAVGNLLGSIVAYLVGFYGGRPLIEKYGKYVLISRQDLDAAQRWFRKYGSVSVFFSRMLPIVRTFISLPAGIARMPFWRFVFYTFLGSLPWAYVLTYAGIVSGENWPILETYFKKFDWLILTLIVLGLGWVTYKKIKRKNL
jgi:membrane protein DedA with SNARE-associated domain